MKILFSINYTRSLDIQSGSVGQHSIQYLKDKMSHSHNKLDAMTNACPLCQNTQISMVFDVETNRRFMICRCRMCHFVFASPIPSQDELIAYYASDYFIQSNKNTGYIDYWNVGEIHMRHMWSELNNYADLSDVPKKTLLDVGCASGGFLHEAHKDGWETTGVELGADAVSRAKNVYNLDVRQDDIFSGTLMSSQFGLITMWHVLEHIPYPVTALRRARELLLPQGLLFIEVPNWNSLGRITKGKSWKQLVPPAHLNYFVKKSLTTAIKEAGLIPIKISTHHIVGFDKLRTKSLPLFMKSASRLAENFVGEIGYGGFLRILAVKAP